ncbi:MAG: AAA family ATPase, partial [Rhodospirillales bacterium]|nr:AAA family ATPase [Rhodospirillales bacterium]
TGLVVVGDAIGMGLSSEQAIIGDTPNLAARLQGIADPGTVVIASGTRDLIGALFELQARPPSQLKGYPVPVPSWTVIQESEIDSRFEALRSGHTHALLGRQAELACLRDGWARARDGAGRVVVLSGEPGIGKSRLIAALEEELRAEPFVRLRYLCAPLYQDTALHPIAAQIGRAARFRNDDTPSLRRRKLDHLLTALRTPAADRATFAALLGLLPEDDPELQRLTPARRKERTFAAILAQLDVLAEAGPVIVVVEDLHWADATTRELLDRLVESVVTRRILLVVTSRPLPQGQHLLPPGPSVQHCVLKRLERPDALVLLEQVVGRDRLPLPAREQILAHADGVPLFLEELARSTVEAPAPDPTGRGGMPPIHVPTSLHASLTARLDRLPGSREIAQMAAVLGRDFAAETFRAMFLVPEERLQTALRALVDAAHAQDMMVFLDVVYNHFGPDGNYISLYAPQFFRSDVKTPWGSAIDFRRPEVRSYFTDNVLMWLSEYHFDGLRFDAVHAITEQDWVDEMAARVRAAFPDRQIHLVLEHHNEASHLERQVDAQWNDDAHNVLHVLLTDETGGYYADYAEDTAAKLLRCLSEGWVYQGQHSDYLKGDRGTPSAHLPPTAHVLFVQNHDQTGNRAFGERLTVLCEPAALEAAIALQLLCPQIPLIFMGEEDASRTPFLFFTDHGPELAEAVRKGRREEFASFAAFAVVQALAYCHRSIIDPAWVILKSRAFDPVWRDETCRHAQAARSSA